MEYISTQNVTLTYFFNLKSSDIENVFPKGSWFWENSVEICDGSNKLSLNPLKNYHYLTLDAYSNDGSYYLTEFKNSGGVKIFENLNSILEFKDVYRKQNIRNKQFNIRINQGRYTGSLDFDTIAELKEKLQVEYLAKKIVPISYTPWDSTEVYEQKMKAVSEIDLLYLYEFQTFEIRKY